ncbi:MAG: protein-disulfide reductase DsbD [Methanomassiliicoccales archaeon]|nr:MAG: protein-disulfide reductase DsbD [Methanomassiliicoccales archaeon]
MDKFKPAESFPIAIEIDIIPPYHINSKIPSEDYLIPTTLNFESQEGITYGKFNFPESHFKKFSFSDKPLAIYEGKIYIFTSISISSDFPGNELILKGSLGYQACDDHTCLAPEEYVFSQKFPIGKSTDSFELINQSIFQLQLKSVDTEKTQLKDEELNFTVSIAKKGWLLTFILVFLGGLALNLTPCVYPLIPITISYFGGQSHGKKGNLVLHAILYVLGMAITYSILGVFAALTGSLFGSALQNPTILIIIAIILVGLSLSMFDLYEIRVPNFLTNFAGGAKQGYFGTFFMGLTVGIVAAPCIGPFVLALLTYVGERGDVVLGFGMFFVLALGLGIPFIFLALFSGSINKIPRSGAWMVWVRNIFGFILIGMAVYFLQPLFPSTLLYYLGLAFTALIGGIYMAWLEPTQVTGKTFAVIRNLIGILFFIISILFFSHSIEAAIEANSASNQGLTAVSQAKINWKPYSEKLLQQAHQENTPVMLDFYADWCIPCKELDKFTFSQPEVIELSQQFLMMKVDLTKAGDPNTQEWRKKYGIKGVPTLVFLDPSLKELKDLRVVGFKELEDFLPIMKKALASKNNLN